jgi:hypothetical protein
MGGQVVPMGKMKNSYNILVGKPEGKRPFGRPWRRWQDNIRKDLMKTGWQGADWM